MCGYEECKCLPIPDEMKRDYALATERYNQTIDNLYLMNDQPEFSCYPKTGDGLYYVEFNRGNIPFEFTLFKRSYIHSSDMWDEIQKSSYFIKGFMSNEGHPYQLFTGTYRKDGCIPDKKWVMWMVDALNEQVKRS